MCLFWSLRRSCFLRPRGSGKYDFGEDWLCQNNDSVGRSGLTPEGCLFTSMSICRCFGCALRLHLGSILEHPGSLDLFFWQKHVPPTNEKPKCQEVVKGDHADPEPTEDCPQYPTEESNIWVKVIERTKTATTCTTCASNPNSANASPGHQDGIGWVFWGEVEANGSLEIIWNSWNQWCCWDVWRILGHYSLTGSNGFDVLRKELLETPKCISINHWNLCQTSVKLSSAFVKPASDGRQF